MQNLASNMQTIEYALYEGMADRLVNGKKTGEKDKVYSDPVTYRIFVSPAKGTAEIDPFGINDNYTNVMSTADMSCPIQEDTVLWIGTTHEEGGYNYRVTRVARGLNSILYAIKKVDVK